MAYQKYSKIQLAVIAVLILFMIIQEVISITQNSLTSDENLYIGAGKEIFETGNLRTVVVMAHPPLSYYIGSIFLIPLKFEKRIWQNHDWKRGQDLIFHSGYDPNKIIFFSRLPFVFLSVFLALYVLKWATELYGVKSGIIALFLYSFNPSIIAYSGIVITDFTVAAMMFIAIYYFWKLFKEPSRKNLILSGIFLGFALLSKITAILLIFIFTILGIICIYHGKYKISIKKLIKNLLIMLFISFLLIFSFYGFQFGTLSNSLPSEFYVDKARQELSKAGFFSKQLIYIYDNVPLPIPSYIGEIGYLFYISSQPNPGYIFGRVTNNVVWYYVYVTFLLKTGITLLIFLAMLFVFRKRLPQKDLLTNLSLWLPILLVFANFSLTNKISGVRHILLVYPFMFILVSNLVNVKLNKQKKYIFIISVLLFYYALSAILIAPHYMAYISEIFLGPNNAHKIIVGSSIDHGQDLYRLKKYMDKNNIKKIKLSYFGQADPKDYNISYEYLPSPNFFVWVPDYKIPPLNERKEDCSEKKELIAISITNLKNVYLTNKTCFDWLKKSEPIDKAGYSIFIYDIK